VSNILLVISSPRGSASYSTRVARALADKLAARDPKSIITVRDLTREPLPHIDEAFATGRVAPPDGNLTAEQKRALAISDTLIKELFAADVIVIASAMINFSISSTLKTYIDYIARPGVTFGYSEKGPEGLVKGKKVYICTARGGVYTHGPMQSANFQDPYLKQALGFIGLTDIEFIAVEGVSFGPEVAEKSYAAALAKAAAMAA
jgi:FMN-dependent NADH-azoreductase